jgi:glycosyltransferase involved in cell wall biosynthesis
MRIDVVFPVLPPTLDGIGDYTAHVSDALSTAGCDVRILTAQDTHDVPSTVDVEQTFSLQDWSGFSPLVEAVRSAPPDWLLIQFEQFAYGRYGFNPSLPLALWKLKRTMPSVRTAVMFHEDFVPVNSWQNAIMTTWQRAQFWALGRVSDLVAFSVEPWARRYQSWFPSTEIAHWPVGSNIPNEEVPYEDARSRIGLNDSTFVAGVFGSLHGARLVDWICEAARALQRETNDLTLLYVGPHGTALRKALPDLDVFDAGALPADQVSVSLSAMDLHLAPFVDGASTRRGSFLAGLQHGVPTVSTHGPLTDSLLMEKNGKAFRLTPSDDVDAFRQAVLELKSASGSRPAMRERAERFFDAHFEWDQIAGRIRSSLEASPHASLSRAHGRPTPR